MSWPSAGKCWKRWVARSSPGRPSRTTARGSIPSFSLSIPSTGIDACLAFPLLDALGHAAEDALADVRSGRRTADAALVSAVVAIIDRIGETIGAIEASGDVSRLAHRHARA